MKKSIWLVLMAAVTASVMAQQVTNTPPTAPMSIPPAPTATADTNAAPALSATTNAPAKPKAASAKKKKKTSPKTEAKTTSSKPAAAKTETKKTPTLQTVPLTPGPATVIASNVNVRGQARLLGEVVTHVTKGQEVTVLEEITLTNSAPDEPSAWAKIVLPSERPVWLSSLFVDTNNNVVTVHRINLRSGPGENYSVLGRLNKGETYKELDRKEDWIKIEAPTNTYAFVAAQYLRSEPPAAAPEVAAATPPPAAAPEPAATAAPLAETPDIASAPTNAPAVAAPEPTPSATDTNTPPAPTPATPTATAAEPAPAPEAAPAEATPPPKRIVQREGVVRGTVSIQAPSAFSLVNTETGRTMDYLVSPSKEFDLRRFKGMRVIVTGEEGLDQRWGNTPVLTFDKLEVLE